MTDTITLPREVVEEALEALQYMTMTAEHCVDNEIPESAIAALRTALAAPPAPTQAAKSLITAPKPMLGLISNEVRAALKAADAEESQEAYLTRTPALAAEQPSEDAERYRKQKERSYRLQRLLKECVKVMQANAVFRDTKAHKDLKTRIRVELEDKT